MIKTIVDYVPRDVLSNNFNDLLALTQTFERFLSGYDSFYSDYYANLIDPMLVDESLLDWRATRTVSPWSLLWNTDWKSDAKRQLLRDEQLIFSQALFPNTLNLLFADFSLDARVEYTSSFILSRSIPATLSSSIFDYRVVANKAYEKGTPERNILNFCVENFGSPTTIQIVLQ